MHLFIYLYDLDLGLWSRARVSWRFGVTNARKFAKKAQIYCGYWLAYENAKNQNNGVYGICHEI